MTTLTKTGMKGARMAMRIRKRFEVPRTAPVDPFDIASKLEVTVRLRPETSLEGMYVRTPGPLILISTLRPRGRRHFTLGHELGHHCFDHGTQVDMYLGSDPHEDTEEERLANGFARHLLMPLPAIRHYLELQGLNPATLTAPDAFQMSSYFGVGYTSVLNHLCWSLNLLPVRRLRKLQKVRPAEIKRELVGAKHNGTVEVVDENWIHRPLDLRVGDFALIPRAAHVNGDNVTVVGDERDRRLIQGVRPGISRLVTNSWAIFVRVAPTDFVGLAKYRHLEREDEDE